jgi:hypothetical protein
VRFEIQEAWLPRYLIIVYFVVIVHKIIRNSFFQQKNFFLFVLFYFEIEFLISKVCVSAIKSPTLE